MQWFRWALAGILASAPVLGVAEQPVEWVNPRVAEFGKVQAYPQAVLQPSASLKYKLVYNVDEGGEPDKLNPALDKAARILNLYALAKVPPEAVELAVIVHGKATPAIMDNEAYRSRFSSDNPNLPLLKALHAAGAEIYICGQALAHSGISQTDVAPDVKLTLSAITALVDFQMDGYTLIP